MIIGGEGQKPGVIVLLSIAPKLRGSGLSRNLDTGNGALFAGPIISVDYTPHSFANKFDLFLGKLVVSNQIAPDFGRPADDRAVRLLDLVDQGGLVINSAVGHGGHDHRHL